jgi:hypothetical protein
LRLPIGLFRTLSSIGTACKNNLPWSILDQATSLSGHRIIGPKRILEIPPQKVKSDIQIKSEIFPGNEIIVEHGKRAAIIHFLPPHFFANWPITMPGGDMYVHIACDFALTRRSPAMVAWGL